MIKSVIKCFFSSSSFLPAIEKLKSKEGKETVKNFIVLLLKQ